MINFFFVFPSTSFVLWIVRLLFRAATAFGQYLLDGLLFLQQKGADDACLYALVTAGSTVRARNGPFALRRASVRGGFQVLDPGQHRLTIGALGSVGLLGDALDLQHAPRRPDAAVRCRPGVVSGPSLTRPAVIGHDLLRNVTKK